MRNAKIERRTAETEVIAELTLDGRGAHEIATGLGLLDHLLRNLALHGLFDLRLQARGDLEVDAHHTVEDVALVLGAAFDQALGDRAGIARVGSAHVPLDEALALAVVDLSGRPFAVFDGRFPSPMVGALPTALVPHFVRSLASTARATIHARLLCGADDHHLAEALFKALGRALDQATALDPRRGGALPSTKGAL